VFENCGYRPSFYMICHSMASSAVPAGKNFDQQYDSGKHKEEMDKCTCNMENIPKI